MWANQQLAKKKKKLLKAQQTFFKKAKCFNKQCFCTCIQNFTQKTQETNLFDPSCYFVIYQQFHIRTSSQKCTVTTCNVFVFGCAIHSNGPLRKHRLSSVGSKVMSVGCDWLILIHVVYFDYDWQLTFSECIVIFL